MLLEGTDLFEQIFQHILEERYKYKLVDPSEVYVDATHVKARADSKKMQKRIAKEEALFYAEKLKEDINKDRMAHGKVLILLMGVVILTSSRSSSLTVPNLRAIFRNYGEFLSLNVDSDNSIIDFQLAIDAAKYYGVTEQDATGIVDSIRENVRNNWRLLAKKYGINRSEIERMNEAFRECE